MRHEPRNVNRIHANSLSLNDRIALFVSQHVGTMWFCYWLAVLMIVWALAQQWVYPSLHIQSFDPYPFSFLFFCLGGVMQSLLMPLIMVAQNQQNKHAEMRAEEQYKFIVKSYEDTERIIGMLDHLLLIEQKKAEAVTRRRRKTADASE